jgi:mannosyltransferase OCH1-like enzyme
MEVSAARIKRVLEAITDGFSYRILWYCLTDHLKPLHGTEVGDGPSGEYGIPDSPAEFDRSQIPKVVFQTWKSYTDMPDYYRYWRRSFLVTNPDFRCFLSNDEDNRNFIRDRFPWFLPRYDSYPHEIFRADVVRFFFLYDFGGFYADMDSECLRPLEGMRNMGDVLLGRLGRDKDFEHSIPNAVMASKAGQAFWLLAIALAAERLQEFLSGGRNDGPAGLTGPILLKDAVDFYISRTAEDVRDYIRENVPELEGEIASSDYGKIVILPPPTWYPLNWNNFIHTVLRKKIFGERHVVENTKARQLFPEAYIVTYWSASWK